MKKYVSDFTVSENIHVNDHYILLKLTHSDPLPEMFPGQFVEIRIDGTPDVMLRRPISIHFVDKEHHTIWLLIHMIGKGTYHLSTLKQGDSLNILFPLGNSFSIPVSDIPVLLVGGGAGIAPMLFLGKTLCDSGLNPTFLLGARSQDDLLQVEQFARYGKVYLSTEDGSCGEKGFVTQHSVLRKIDFKRIYACGPKPMMVAVAKYAKERKIDCEVSLENKMACGIGACLCCVENTKEGNLCVCKEGPVFNVKQLLWQI